MCLFRSDNIASSLTHVTQDVPENPETESETPAPPTSRFSRSQSEKLLNANKEFIQQEKELKDKYHEIVNN